nr:MAG TPA: hypothetical protein [Caudoviricetes sp.]
MLKLYNRTLFAYKIMILCYCGKSDKEFLSA